MSASERAIDIWGEGGRGGGAETHRESHPKLSILAIDQRRHHSFILNKFVCISCFYLLILDIWRDVLCVPLSRPFFSAPNHTSWDEYSRTLAVHTSLSPSPLLSAFVRWQFINWEAVSHNISIYFLVVYSHAMVCVSGRDSQWRRDDSGKRQSDVDVIVRCKSITSWQRCVQFFILIFQFFSVQRFFFCCASLLFWQPTNCFNFTFLMSLVISLASPVMISSGNVLGVFAYSRSLATIQVYAYAWHIYMHIYFIFILDNICIYEKPWRRFTQCMLNACGREPTNQYTN